MNRFMTYLNFLGVIALTVLCLFQWQANNRIDAQLTRANQTRLEQTAKIAEQDSALRENATEMADLRQRLSLADTDLKDAQDKLAADNQQRDQLKGALDKWIAAVAQRDQALKQAGERLATLTAQDNQAVQKFNDLADKYNQVVKQLDEARAKE
jgi:chromosome segregation ATPase